MILFILLGIVLSFELLLDQSLADDIKIYKTKYYTKIIVENYRCASFDDPRHNDKYFDEYKNICYKNYDIYTNKTYCYENNFVNCTYNEILCSNCSYANCSNCTEVLINCTYNSNYTSCINDQFCLIESITNNSFCITKYQSNGSYVTYDIDKYYSLDFYNLTHDEFAGDVTWWDLNKNQPTTYYRTNPSQFMCRCDGYRRFDMFTIIYDTLDPEESEDSKNVTSISLSNILYIKLVLLMIIWMI